MLRMTIRSLRSNNHLRHFSLQTLKKSLGTAKGRVAVLPFPRMSPTMTSGKVTKWFVQPGQYVKSYDLFLEIETSSLVQESSRVGIETIDILEVEILEDMYVAKLCSPLELSLNAGNLLAILCDDPEDVAVLSALDFLPNESIDLYDSCHSLQLALWQGYVKSNSGIQCTGCS